MSSINDLLNHEQPAAPDRRESAASFTHPAPFDPADALTALATLGSGQQYAAGPTRDLPSPTASAHAPPRPTSCGSHHAPVAPVAASPTLDQYHHGSRSPEEQKRRQSLMDTSSPAPLLAPIQQDEPSSAPIGTPMSHIVPPTTRSSEGGELAPDVAQHREPDEVKAESLPISRDIHTRLPSPQPTIKKESTGTPRESTPAIMTTQPERHNSATAEILDAETLKALEVAKQADLGLRKKRMGSESVAVPMDSKTSLAPSKKRPAPSSVSAPKKKGTAKAVKPSKKRKIDPEDDSTARSVTPSARPPKSATRGIKRGSQAGTPNLESSPAPDNSSQVAASDDDGDSSEDHNLYCLCKKPDNHRWMIGCDGGCDDWFHGDCVNMKQADEGLVDKFICPLCEENGRGHTTWKPMCRRDGCRRPARVFKERESKYCSEECGTLFMTEQLQRTAGAMKTNGVHAIKDKSKKKKKPADGAAEEEEPTPLGGTLRSKDLKALVDASPNIQTFRNLGTGVLSPPQTASPTCVTFNGNSDPGLALTTGETERLTALHKEKSQLQDRLEVLKDREKFVSMAKEQALRVAEREKIKAKEFCGYDCRLSWSDAEFLLWRNKAHGKASFKFSTLSPTPEQIASIVQSAAATNGETLPASSSSSSSGPAADAEADTVCLKKRCSKHPQWQKLNLQDARFEELEVVEAIRECEKEEKSVRERARRRGAKDGLAKELMVGEGGGGAVMRNREGWVEVVGS
ncbi:hypothetical protein J1614_005600 [Plenodomus biglobosus]|nr:hypothetical protein J1614_005600 [Plenodomus biglobosus]